MAESRSEQALVVFAHGSRIAAANESVVRVARAAAEQAGLARWRAAFLELGEPDLAGAIRELSREGARKIVVTPYLLTMGVHLSRDLPRLLAEAAAQAPGVELLSTPPLDPHPALAAILAARAREALEL